jgi:hypothetical protein
VPVLERGRLVRPVNKSWKTEYRLWAMFAAMIFVLLAFVDPLGGMDKGEHGVVAYGRLLLEGKYNNQALITAIVILSILQAIPALLVGWIIQAIIVIRWSYLRCHHRAAKK